MFKVGDWVERIKDTHAGMCVGNYAQVVRTGSAGAIGFAEPRFNKRHPSQTSDVWHAAENFKAIPTPAPKAVPAGEADPSGISLHAPGAKADAGKLRPALVLGAFAPALEQVVAVGTFGAKKYSDNGWLEVPDAFNRYSDAQGRHELKRFKGELVDDDSKLLHLAHEAWNALAKLTLYLRDNPTKA